MFRPDKGKARGEPARHAEAEVFKFDIVIVCYPRESGSRRVAATVNPGLQYNVLTLQFLGSLGYMPASNPPDDLGEFTVALPGYRGWRRLYFDIIGRPSLKPRGANFLVVDDDQSDDVVLGQEFENVPEPVGVMAPTHPVFPRG